MMRDTHPRQADRRRLLLAVGAVLAFSLGCLTAALGPGGTCYGHFNQPARF